MYIDQIYLPSQRLDISCKYAATVGERPKQPKRPKWPRQQPESESDCVCPEQLPEHVRTCVLTAVLI